MRKTLFCAAALAAVCAVACVQKDMDVRIPDNAEEVELAVSVPQALTKATDTEGEETVESLQVFVFRKDGALDAWSSAQASSLTLKCPAGDKDIVAVVNAPEITISDKTALEEAVTQLSDNAKGRYVMYGSKAETVVASSSIEVPVSRKVARIAIHKITNAFSLEQYQESELELSRIYLVNVAGDAIYGKDAVPSIWHNMMQLENDLPDILESGEIGEQIAYGSSYSVPHYFYCYPNGTEQDSSDEVWSARYTRLVVEVKVDGVPYYYPVSVPDIKSNHKYEITELKITRLGSDSPDEPVSVQEASFTVSVQDWTPGTSGTVEI